MMKTDGLITCGLVCSGVASRKAWREYVHALEEKYGPLASYVHRPKQYKQTRGSSLPERATFEDGKVVQGSRLTTSWKKSYGSRRMMRPVCHDCPFHSLERVEDITIGDFWGLDERSPLWREDGTSLVLFNRKNDVIDQVKRGLFSRSDCCAYPVEVASNAKQPRLLSSSSPHIFRNRFLAAIDQEDWLHAVRANERAVALRKLTRQTCWEAPAESLKGDPVVEGKRLSNRLVGQKLDCYGCGACANICAHRAISMREDSEGFLYPIIDEGRCIGCGMCNHVCPRQDSWHDEKDLAQECFALRLTDSEDFEKSASGGAFWGIAESVLSDGGVVYGAAFDDDWQVRHIRCDSETSALKCRGSKYAQSDMGDIFEAVEQDLSIGRCVLFAGTPCQAAAVKKYLSWS